MKSFITLFAFLSIAFPIVNAHGFLSSVTIGGQTFQGNAPGRSAKSSPIRQTNSQNPIKGAKNQAVNCGPGAKVASQTVTARAGSSISFKWSAADGSRWPHNTGPMLVYAAKCSGPCNKFNSANARWFKVDQVGKEGNQWAQQRLMNGGSHNSKIPDNLAPGEYLFKHEIIALHLANQQGGAEFYEGCVQVKVTGSGTGAPSNNELVSLPGAYSDNQKGILFNAFGNEKYPFPGPAISKLSSRASGRSLTADEVEETEEETNAEELFEEEQPEEESTTTSEEEESTEEEQPEEETSEEEESETTTTTEHYPRVISRVMRGIYR